MFPDPLVVINWLKEFIFIKSAENKNIMTLLQAFVPLLICYIKIEAQHVYLQGGTHNI